MVSIRGAVTVENNDKNEILAVASQVLEEIINVNNLDKEDIISVIFTCTRDLDQVYPARAAREMGLLNAALLCFQEMYVKGSLEKCVRVMVNADVSLKQKDVRHVYLGKAVTLRPDLT
jgi:chorismate mutase